MEIEILLAYLLFLSVVSILVLAAYCICASTCCEYTARGKLEEEEAMAKEEAKINEGEKARFDGMTFFQKIPIAANFFLHLSDEYGVFSTQQQFFKKISFLKNTIFVPFLCSLPAIANITKKLAAEFISTGEQPLERVIRLSPEGTAFHIFSKFGQRNGKANEGKIAHFSRDQWSE